MSPCTSKGTADSTKDDDGNTVEPTDEENAAAKAKAESDAAAVLARVQGGEALEDVARDYESASYTSTDAGSNNGSDVANWVFDSARKGRRQRRCGQRSQLLCGRVPQRGPSGIRHQGRAPHPVQGRRERTGQRGRDL